MEFFMTDNTKILIRNCLFKAGKSLDSSQILLENKDVDAAFNRIYYSIFYSVMALGYKYGFITSKHRQLMGWFNKKFINEDKVFSSRMYQIYKTAYDNRQESDYNLILVTNKKMEEVEEALADADFFVRQIADFLGVV